MAGPEMFVHFLLAVEVLMTFFTRKFPLSVNVFAL